jgi:hypothetical protein
MKNIQYLLIVIISIFTLNISAQNNSEKDIIGMQKELAQVINSMVENAKHYYNEGDSYENFKKELYGAIEIAPIPKEGEAIIEKVYYYLKTKTPSSIVLKDSGEVIYNAILFSKNTAKNNKVININSVLFGVTANDNTKRFRDSHPCNCCFFCFSCQINCVYIPFNF